MPKVGVVSDRYDPHKVEEHIKEYWSSNKIYEKIKKINTRLSQEFIFIDGPPYPSSDIPHVGTAWNKAIKDVILRYKRLRGFKVHDQPGYDCHGLPIEVTVEKSLGIKSKREIEEKVGVDKFIELCKSIVLKNVESMTFWFKELGVFMDWNKPYLTLKDSYIESGWKIIKKANELGLLTNEERVVYWCPRCSTTLAEYEVEYKELTDPSIYVKFPVRGKEKEYILIWTTTPWTLPANTFVMAHPDATYVKVRIGDEVLILAKERLENVLSEASIKEYEIIEEVKGKDLEGLEYDHPLTDLVPLQRKLSKYHKVILTSEFVTLTEGTGLVHAAPGHGFEDFIVAKEVGIELIASPVNDEGKFTEEAGKYQGLYVRDANKEIIRDLRRLGALLHASSITHRYPVCWRCKTPVVLRTREQWVLKISKLRNKLIEEVSKANWIPKWALDRIMAMLDNLQDWVLSRQRYWGTPLPIWICPNGHKLVIGSKNELVKYGGKVPKELHRPWVDEVVLKCPYCGLEMRRVPDVIDVWFDSGIAFFASDVKEGGVVADFITEGHDQTRGWFFSLLRAGVIAFGKVPYKNVLVHGFVLDERGREMHKSLGNYVGLDEALKKVGRDVFRLGVLQNTVWEDLRFSWKLFDDAKKDLSIAWNVFVFASTYMNLDNFDPKKEKLDNYLNYLRFEDKWILSRLNNLVIEVTKALDEYRVHDAIRLLRRFIVEDVSHWYIRLVRPRVWVEENTPDKLAVYTTLYEVLKSWLIMMAPFAPFFTEELYLRFIRPAEEDLPESIHMLSWPRIREEFLNKKVEEDMELIRKLFEATAAARMKAKIKLRQPVKSVIVYTNDEGIIRIIKDYRELLFNILNTKDIMIKKAEEVSEIVSYKVEPIYKSLGPKYRSLTKKIIAYIESNSDVVAKDIISKGYHGANVEGTAVRLTMDDVKVIPTQISGYAIQETRWGCVVIDTRLTDAEIAEGIARDVVRRIQTMRKELRLPMDAHIVVSMLVPEEHRKYVKSKLDYIAGEVRAKEIRIADSKEELIGDLIKEWKIEELKYVIAIRKTEP